MSRNRPLALSSSQVTTRRMPPTTPGFVMFEPRPEGMAIVQLAFAADWPRWTDKQAAAMGLLCAECGYDIRKSGRHRSAEESLGQCSAERSSCGHV